MADATVLLYTGEHKAVNAYLGLNMALKRNRTFPF